MSTPIPGAVAPFAGTRDDLRDLLLRRGDRGVHVTAPTPPPNQPVYLAAEPGRHAYTPSRGIGRTTWVASGEAQTAAQWLRALCRSIGPSIVAVEDAASALAPLELQALATTYALAVVTISPGIA